jgi:hypothetical protein
MIATFISLISFKGELEADCFAGIFAVRIEIVDVTALCPTSGSIVQSIRAGRPEASASAKAFEGLRGWAAL